MRVFCLKIIFIFCVFVSGFSKIYASPKRKISFSHYKHQITREVKNETTDDLKFNRQPLYDEFFPKAENCSFFKEELVEFLKDYTMIYCGGFLSELASIGSAIGLSGVKNWERQEELFEAWSKESEVKLDVRRLDSDTFASVNSNTERLHDLVHRIISEKGYKKKKGIILIGHSKGGLEILNFLLDYPDLQNEIKGVVTFQSPFYGSPIADIFIDLNWARFVSAGILGLKNGTHFKTDGLAKSKNKWKKVREERNALNESLHDLMIRTRSQYMDEHKIEIERITKNIPIVNYMSYIDPDEEDGKSLLTHPSGLLSKSLSVFSHLQGKEKNDYFVPLNSQYLDGAYYVTGKGDHLSGVCWSESCRRKQQLNLSKTLLLILEGLILEKN